MYQPIENWIPLDRDTSPTTASGNLYNALVAGGAKPVNLGQGREIVELPLLQKLTIEAFEQAIKGGKLLHSKYGAPSVELNAASAAWLQRIMNIDATKDTTFTLKNQGRAGLYAAFHLLASLAGFRQDGRIVVPKKRLQRFTPGYRRSRRSCSVRVAARPAYSVPPNPVIGPSRQLRRFQRVINSYKLSVHTGRCRWCACFQSE